MKPSPTPSLFPLITPSTVPLVRGECSRKGAKHKKRQKKERGKIKNDASDSGKRCVLQQQSALSGLQKAKKPFD